MFNKAARAGLIPGLIVSLVLASALLMPANQGAIRLVCGGYGYGGPCAVPDVRDVHPGAATIAGGTLVTIDGTDFNNIAPPATKPIVRFGGVAATVVSFTDTKIMAISPAHAAGVVDVTVTTAAGTSVPDPGDQFRYVSAKYCALIDMSRTPTSWSKGVAQKWYVSVFNCGTHSWPATGNDRVDISVHFTTKAGTGATTKASWLGNTYHNLSRSIAPNGSTQFAITLNPGFRGTVKVEGEMIVLHVLWFGRYLARPAQFAWVTVVVH
jgi:hypothetical protein